MNKEIENSNCIEECSAQRQREIYKVTLVGSVVNLLLTAFKFLAGVLGHSSAMVADAVHSLSDLVSDVVVLVLVKISGRPEDADHDYGHAKYETLGSVIIGIILFAVGIGLLVSGVRTTLDFFQGQPIGDPNWLAFIAALISIASKEWLFHYTRHSARRVESDALEANAWHHRSDALTSIATLIGIAGAMFLGPKWHVLDPLAAAFVSIFIIAASVEMIKKGIDQLMEKSLSADIKNEITQIVLSTPGVADMHHLRTRRIGSRNSIEMHIKMAGDMTLTEAHAIATLVEHHLKDRFGQTTHTIIHMEPMKEA